MEAANPIQKHQHYSSSNGSKVSALKKHRNPDQLRHPCGSFFKTNKKSKAFSEGCVCSCPHFSPVRHGRGVTTEHKSSNNIDSYRPIGITSQALPLRNAQLD